MNKTLGMTLLAATALAACGGDGSADISGTGSLSIGVTDAPVDDADEVVVTFTAVELLGEDDALQERFELDEPQQIDLLSLQGTDSELLVNGESVPVGTYEQVRLIVDAPAPSCNNPAPPFASFITIDGVQNPLVVPSGNTSGLKVRGPLTVAQGGATAYTVDFDLRKAIAERGNTGCFNLRPVLRVVDNAEVGTLTGTVDGDLLSQSSCTADTVSGEGAAVYLYNGADVTPDDAFGDAPEALLTTALLSPLDDGSGDFSYTVGFLLAGDYTAAFTCQASDDAPETNDAVEFDPVANVSIVVDTETTQDFELAAQEEETTPAN